MRPDIKQQGMDMVPSGKTFNFISHEDDLEIHRLQAPFIEWVF